MPDDTLQLDPSLTVPSVAQSQPDLSLFGFQQNVPRAQPVTFQDLRQYLGRAPSQQPSQQQPSQQQPSQQIQHGGRAPATIRYNNPGGMWPGPSSKKFGGTNFGVLHDGNLIASFDDPVNGAAAQFDLLDSRKYINRPIGDLIGEWSGYTGGAKNVATYAAHVANSIGLSPGDRLTPELLRSPQGIEFAKAQARMETGYDYPLTNDQWSQAQQLAFGKEQATQVAQAGPAQAPQQVTPASSQQWQDLSQYLSRST